MIQPSLQGLKLGLRSRKVGLRGCKRGFRSCKPGLKGLKINYESLMFSLIAIASEASGKADKTLSPLVPSGAAALLTKKITQNNQKQGKGTDDHILPLGI